jgi:uncharacterized protein (DUF1810 family)
VDRLFPYNFAMSLERFLQAQEKGGSYERALTELKAGRKKGCWIWWVFPQLKRPDVSECSTYYGLDDDAEARAYIGHPILGPRYLECVRAVHGHLCQGGVAPLVLMGSEVDILKLGSSLELFLKVAPKGEAVFRSQAEEILTVLG